MNTIQYYLIDTIIQSPEYHQHCDSKGSGLLSSTDGGDYESLLESGSLESLSGYFPTTDPPSSSRESVNKTLDEAVVDAKSVIKSNS